MLHLTLGTLAEEYSKSDNLFVFIHENQLGRSYGNPLPKEIRYEIVKVSLQRVRPCDICRRLGIFHGFASKLLSKYSRKGWLNLIWRRRRCRQTPSYHPSLGRENRTVLEGTTWDLFLGDTRSVGQS